MQDRKDALEVCLEKIDQSRSNFWADMWMLSKCITDERSKSDK